MQFLAAGVSKAAQGADFASQNDQGYTGFQRDFLEIS